MILRFAAIGGAIAVAVPLLGQAFQVFPAWLMYVVLVLCPSSLMLMATEGCSGISSWCSIQIVLLMVLANVILYGFLGAFASKLLLLVGRLRARDAV
ncbi:MAG: hypothetical protein EBU46_04280 [Nitrosomonadaceae bacterium]|nr:hypothetical protein [Nitrosomonadaceae bacterium]